jgi:hypothetical protein
MPKRTTLDSSNATSAKDFNVSGLRFIDAAPVRSMKTATLTERSLVAMA